MHSFLSLTHTHTAHLLFFFLSEEEEGAEEEISTIRSLSSYVAPRDVVMQSSAVNPGVADDSN